MNRYRKVRRYNRANYFIEKYTDIEENLFYRDDVLKLPILKSLEIMGEVTS